MAIDWNPLKSIVRAHDRFLVTTHVRPDGDALGSEVGMAGLLRGLGKDVRVVNVSPTPPRYDFLDPKGQLFERFNTDGVRPADLADREVVVILDLSSWSQLDEMAEFVRSFPGRRVVIDHHLSEDDLGALVFKNVEAEATGALVHQAIRALDAPITPEMATGLLSAMAMDTGWFRHPTTGGHTLRAAADLIDSGADIHAIYRWLFERSTQGRIRMLGRAMAGLRTEAEGRIAYMVVTRDDFIGTGAVPPDTEDLVDMAVSIGRVEVGMLFIEQPKGGAKVSLRSRGSVDVSAIARQFGGGGHRAAAGAGLPDPLSESLPRVLDAVKQVLGVSEHQSSPLS